MWLTLTEHAFVLPSTNAGAFFGAHPTAVLVRALWCSISCYIGVYIKFYVNIICMYNVYTCKLYVSMIYDYGLILFWVLHINSHNYGTKKKHRPNAWPNTHRILWPRFQGTTLRCIYVIMGADPMPPDRYIIETNIKTDMIKPYQTHIWLVVSTPVENMNVNRDDDS